jgi:hypothetical protein
MGRMSFAFLLNTTNVNLVASVFDDDPTRVVVMATLNIGRAGLRWAHVLEYFLCCLPPPPAPPSRATCMFLLLRTTCPPPPSSEEFLIDFDTKSPNVVARVTGM